MLKRRQDQSWNGVNQEQYKDEPGTWMKVSRHSLFSSQSAAFEARVFSIDAGGYSSFEKHEHEHCVIVLNGMGKVRLNDEWHTIGPEDVVHVEPNQPHQFASDEGMEIICIVNKDRDRPILLGNDQPV